jgi:hypothetical protein
VRDDAIFACIGGPESIGDRPEAEPATDARQSSIGCLNESVRVKLATGRPYVLRAHLHHAPNPHAIAVLARS